MFARGGNASAVTLIRTTHNTSGSCSKPNDYVVVPPTLTGKALSAALLAFFQTRNSLDAGDCAAFTYAFRSPAETKRSGYTAGAVINDDHQLTVIDGPVGSTPDFTISY